jgi:hypothetical protein
MGDLNAEPKPVIVVTSDSSENAVTVPLINGIIAGREVTLLESVVDLAGGAMPGYFTFRGRPKYVIFGRHITSSEGTTLRGVRCEYSGLIEWLQLGGITRSFQERDGEMTEVSWSYSYPKLLEWEVDDLRLTGNTGLDSKNPRHGFSATEYGYVKIVAGAERSISAWVSDVVLPIRDMLRLAMLPEVNIEGVRAIFPDQLGNAEAGTRDDVSCELIVNGQFATGEAKASIWEHDYLFRAKNLTNEVLERFLDRDSNRVQLRETFLASEHELMYDSNRFLTYVRILESLHRRLFPVSEEEKAAFQASVDVILESVPEEYKELVSRNLMFAYEPPLPERLHALIKPWKPLLAPVFGGKLELADEINRIARERNVSAHLLEDSERKFDPDGLRRANHFLGVAIRLVVLQDIGFTVEQAGEIVKNTRLFSELTHLYKNEAS